MLGLRFAYWSVWFGVCCAGMATGDHVPIMPSVYAALGTPCGDVDYFIWNSTGGQTKTPHRDAAIHDLAREWMCSSGVMFKQTL